MLKANSIAHIYSPQWRLMGVTYGAGGMYRQGMGFDYADSQAVGGSRILFGYYLKFGSGKYRSMTGMIGNVNMDHTVFQC